MLTVIVKSAKAFVLTYIATEVLIDAVVAIRNRMSTRSSELAWDGYIRETETPLSYDPIKPTVD